MSSTPRPSGPRLTEARLLSWESEALEVAVPVRLRSARWERWDGSAENGERLVVGLKFYALHGIGLRRVRHGAPVWTAEPTRTRAALEEGRVVLVRQEDGVEARVGVQRFLDDNPVFAWFVRLERGYQLTRRAAWDSWDHALAWAEDGQDPHAGLFDLPADLREPPDDDRYLFGWRLDIAHGVTEASGVLFVRLLHPDGRALALPLSRLRACYARGQTPMERLGSRPLRSGALGYDYLVREVSLLHEHAQVVELDRRSGAEGRTRRVPLQELLDYNADLAPLVLAALDEEVVRIQRELARHARDGGTFNLPWRTRSRLGLPLLRLIGWTAVDLSLETLRRGLVPLSHPEESVRVQVALHELIRSSGRRSDRRSRLKADPVRWIAPNGELHARFIRRWDESSFFLTPMPGRTASDEHPQGHADLIRTNPSRLPLILEAFPEILRVSTDVGLREVLLEQYPGAEDCLLAYKASIEAPIPFTATPEAIQLANEALEVPGLPFTRSFTDHHGASWTLQRVTEEGRFRFLRLDPTVARPRLTGPVAGDGETEGLLAGGETPKLPVLEVSPFQLVFVNHYLAAELRRYQDASGLLDEQGVPVPRYRRLERILQRAHEDLSDRLVRAKEHRRRVPATEDGQKTILWLGRYIESLSANVTELERGRWISTRCREDALHRLGVAIGAGNFSKVARRSGDDRLVFDDGIVSRYTGRWILAMVGGGESAHPDPAGPMVRSALDGLERAVANTLGDCVDLDEVEPALLATIAAEADRAAAPRPFASIVIAVQHVDSAETFVAWCGHSAALRYDRNLGTLRRITFEQSLIGIGEMAREAGLSQEDAVVLSLVAASGRDVGRAPESVPEAELLEVARRYASGRARRALRAAWGAPTQVLADEHQRLLELFEAWNKALGGRLDPEPLRRGRQMIFLRRLRLRPNERLILASDGLRPLLDRRPMAVKRALEHTDAQRAAELLLEWSQAYEGPVDDLALIVLDGAPSSRFRPTHARHGRIVHRITPEQQALADRAVVPHPTPGRLPVQLRRAALGEYYEEIDRLVQRRRLSDPSSGVRFAEELVQHLVNRTRRPPEIVSRPGAVEELPTVYEREGDEFSTVLLAAALLRRFGLDARYVQGLRVEDGIAREGHWVEVRAGGAFVLDGWGARRTRARPLPSAYLEDEVISSGFPGLGRRVSRIRRVPAWETLVHEPVKEDPADTWEVFEPLRVLSASRRSEPDAWLVTRPAARPAPPPSEPASPGTGGTSAPPPVEEAPAAPEPPPPPPTGWLDLD